ncbi:hypothetical protein L6164_019614 [Bauhinia variegata]|uniref:Uncharacterized protein n=1 Tax=Bauhinia variegata TaxID=167791 RepID=A0ACB9MUG2_BAUVA|nr:hypothetical protein L6164_019614 [Bauhinia variegata]
MVKVGCDLDGHLYDTKFSQPIPWIGIYIAAASLLCLIGMAADALLGFRRRKFWFPCKFFSLNATSLTLIAVALKLSVDLNTPMPSHRDQLAKLSSSAFVCTIIGNSMPSLGAMENKEILMNVMALGILVITIIVNICIQFATGVIYVFWQEHALIMFLMLILLLIMFSSALTVPTTKHFLELKYKKKYELALKECSVQTGGTIIDKTKFKLMKFWIMAHTSSPQFVMGRSPTCTASGAFCLLSALILAEAMLRSYFLPWSFRFCTGQSDYKWSTILILAIQGAAVGVGTIAPACRWFIAINFRCPKVNNTSRKMEFKVERYWIETLLEMKECPINLRIFNRRHRKLAHAAKLFCLKLCIQMQIGIVLMCKVVQLISISVVSTLLACHNLCRKWKYKLNKSDSTCFRSGTESQSDSKPDLSRFVLHLQGEEALVKVVMRNNCDATDHWIQVGESRQPNLLIKLLEKSSIMQGFKQVGAFDSDLVPSLHAEEPPNSWSLPLVTLASIALALPNINRNSVKELMFTLTESLPYVKLVEHCVDREGKLINIRRAAEIVWHGVDLYHKWLDVDLHELSVEAKSSKEAVEKLAEAAKARYERLKIENINICIKASPSHWPIKLLAANSMFRLCQTSLLSSECTSDLRSERLFEEITVVISDILGACLTNLLHVMSAKCLDSTIEEREDNVGQAVHILGKTKKIIEMLDSSEFPCFNSSRSTNIDDWRIMHKQKKNQLPSLPSSPQSDNETSFESSDLYLTID